MTQKNLEKLTGFNQNTVSNHENGNRSLNEDNIRRYAKTLKTTTSYLFEQAKQESSYLVDSEIRGNFSRVVKNRIKELKIDVKFLSKKLRSLITYNSLGKWKL